MLRKIWKYPISTSVKSQTIEMPSGAMPLCIKKQRSEHVLYMLVDDGAEKVSRKIYSMWTGDWSYITARLRYIDTLMLGEDDYVIHVFIEDEI